ncbi:amidase [Virgibacillus phasianinus]|uniref:Amidase n=1 Tax=Virgibacillus phasianinus TaxID=2017483 RepID=A0A220U3K3_9BACI|nr:amidase [Virgibacillus phasianinus]ASK62313.1 amidase [Virgibacillus phasianinus]
MKLVMDWNEWSDLDAMGIAELVRNGEITPREVAQQVSAGVEALNPEINSVIEIFDDVVKDPLKDGMDPEGVFAGVPFLMKDLSSTVKGRLQEMGSLMMKGNRATADSFLTKQIRNAGLNIIGRTTTPEFGLCSSAENPDVYITRNPWNLDYTTCGSSAGTAASVAAGIIPISHATDGGGSIRIPAGVNGNIGLKPSRGVFSAAPNSSDLMNVVSAQGCHTRTIRDTAAFVDNCRGGAPGEFMPYWKPSESYTEQIRRDPKKLRIAVSHEWGDYRATPHIVAELERAAHFLEGLGHHVEWVVPDVNLHAAYEAQTSAYIMKFAQTISNILEQKGLERPPADLIEPMCIRVFEEGRFASYAERARMQGVFNKTSRELATFFEDWDIILTPVMASPTPLLGTKEYLTISDNPSVYNWFENLWGIFAYTSIANLCGLPGISLPMAEMENGMPFGIHALARQGDDGLLLQLGAQIERALDGKWNHGRKPAVHVSEI